MLTFADYLTLMAWYEPDIPADRVKREWFRFNEEQLHGCRRRF